MIFYQEIYLWNHGLSSNHFRAIPPFRRLDQCVKILMMMRIICVSVFVTMMALSLVVINRSPGDPHGSQFLCQQQLLMMSPDQCVNDHVRVRLVMTIRNIC